MGKKRLMLGAYIVNLFRRVARPVVKMVRGQNVPGHSAPFPAAIPELLIRQMSRGTCVLDPFSGSMTTGRTAYRYGLRSMSVDLHREYCDLGLSLLRRDTQEALPVDAGL